MKVLIACEFSGVVRRAFRALGHDAWSCDLLPSEDDSPHHFCEDVLKVIHRGWHLMIAHPPCTDLAVSGARWFSEKRLAGTQQQAIAFFMELANAPIDHVALENPVSIMSTVWRKPDQIVHPWWFGHGETKSTCLWLKNLPKLVPTCVVDGREHRVHRMPPSEDRWRERSRTYAGVGSAMARQWHRVHVTHNPVFL